MGAVVSAAADATADETGPEVCIRVTDTAFSGFFVVAGELIAFAEVVLCVSTHGTAAAFPFLEACTMEDMLADDC